MNIRDILTLYDYNYWATRRILAASMQVSPEQFMAPTAHSFGSLRGTLVHALDGECAWRMLCHHQTIAFFGALKEDAFPTCDVLARRWYEEERAMREYLALLTDDDVNAYVRYTTPEGEKRERLLWHCLLHVVNHGTQHRSEAAAILTGYGSSPGLLDFTAFLNEQHG
ncbi:MAG TPA: DinB family protein [Herpetosiphonaceae bacterium]